MLLNFTRWGKYPTWLYQLTISPAVHRRFCCSQNSLPIPKANIYLSSNFHFILLLLYSLIELSLILVWGVKWEPKLMFFIHNPFFHHHLLGTQVLFNYTFKSFSCLLWPDDLSGWISVSFCRGLLNTPLRFYCNCIRSMNYFGLKPTFNSSFLYSQTEMIKVLTA